MTGGMRGIGVEAISKLIDVWRWPTSLDARSDARSTVFDESYLESDISWEK
jgi:hypothetical protein